MSDWDQRIWRLATNPLVIGFAALLQMRQIAIWLHAGGAIEDVLLLQWLLPLACTIALATAVAFWGFRNMWSLTQTVLVGLAVTMVANPLIKAYIALLARQG